MRLVRYEDENGWKFQSWLQDNLPISEAEKGIPHNPPDLTRLDWDEILRELNNLLLERGLITLKDVSDSGNLQNTIVSVIKPRLIELYKENPGYVQP